MERTDYDNEVTPVLLERIAWLRGDSLEEQFFSAVREVARLREVIQTQVETLSALRTRGELLCDDTRELMLAEVADQLAEAIEVEVPQ
ncbi:MAG TPA: hypothetical protein VM580_06555 [Labilithrix sp.]|jgi:hypothetical protein|nr:hypothetical protein [Labilithrix sp.]